MPDRDGFITAAESQRLEKQAEELLKQDARERGFIRENGRGFSDYARASGITTKKTLETTYKHEVLIYDQPTLGEWENVMTRLAANRPGERHTKGRAAADDF